MMNRRKNTAAEEFSRDAVAMMAAFAFAIILTLSIACILWA